MKNIEQEEKEHLDYVISVIKERIESAKDNLDKQKHFIIGFKEGQRGTQFNRQALMSMYATEMNDLLKHLDSPFFGKFVYRTKNGEEKEIYIGKRAITDSNGKMLVYDWRSPICSIYYDYSVGPIKYYDNGEILDGELLSKRQFNIKNGEMLSIDELDSLNDDAVLLKYLSENNDARLKSIIATIQTEQNKIIRSPLNKDYIIQGVAGAGKTTVALHRIAYLVYNEAKKIKESNFLILGPNKYFLNYVSELLPELDIDNVEQTTFESIGLDNIGGKMKLESKNVTLQNVLSNKIDIDTLKYKSSLEYLDELEKFVKSYIVSNLQEPIKLCGMTICGPGIMERIYSEYGKGSYSKRVNDLIKLMVKKLKDDKEYYMDDLRKQYSFEIKYLSKEDPKRREVFDNLDMAKEQLNKGCSDLFKEYFKFIKEKPLYIYIRFIMESKMSEEAKKLTIERLKKKQVGFEDLTPLLYINYLINGIDKYQEYTHLIIDESQDLSLAQFYVLQKMFPNCTFDIYGDINQSIYDYNSIRNWDELNSTIFDDRAELGRLDKSYRTTSQISDASNLVLESINYDKASCISRSGEEVDITNNISYENLNNQILGLRTMGYKNIAIICKDDNESNMVYSNLSKTINELVKVEENNEKYSGGICVMPSYLSKGLEFEAVIIYDADKEKYMENDIDMKLLYVAMTRAMHKLIINYSSELPESLKKLENIKTKKVEL